MLNVKISHLGDMNEAFHAGSQFNKCTKGYYSCNFALNYIIYCKVLSTRDMDGLSLPDAQTDFLFRTTSNFT